MRKRSKKLNIEAPKESTVAQNDRHQVQHQQQITLPAELLINILKFTRCAQTISRTRQSCKAFQQYIDGQQSLWKHTDIYSNCLKPDIIFHIYGWSPLKVVKYIYGWSNTPKGNRRKVNVNNVVDFQSFTRNVKSSDIFVLQPIQRFWATNLWDLGDGNYAVFCSFRGASYAMDSLGNMIEWSSSVNGSLGVHGSRYFVSACKTHISHWSPSNQVRVHCQNIKELPGFLEEIHGVSYRRDVMLVVGWTPGVRAYNVQVWSISQLSIVWSKTIPATALRGVDFKMNDLFVVAFQSHLRQTQIQIYDIKSGETLKSVSYARESLYIDPHCALTDSIAMSFSDITKLKLSILQVNIKGYHMPVLKFTSPWENNSNVHLKWHSESQGFAFLQAVGGRMSIVVYDVFHRNFTPIEVSGWKAMLEDDTKEYFVAAYRTKKGNITASFVKMNFKDMVGPQRMQQK